MNFHDSRRYLASGAMNPDDALCVWCAVAAAVQRPDALRAGVVAAIEQKTPLLTVYEAILQTYLFAGFPAGIEGLSVFSEVVREHDANFTPPVAESYNAALFAGRGLPLCKTVYGSVFSRMSAAASDMSPDLYSWMIIEGYGKTLSRAGAASLTRELCIIGVLAALGWQRQLFSHIRGAINVGATAREVRHAVEICAFLSPNRIEPARETLSEAIGI